MINVFLYISIGFILIFSIALISSMYKLLLIYKKNINQLEKKSEIDFLENLQLATADQLLKELRKRKNIPFILLEPVKEKDCNGIKIESHGMNSVASLATIHLAKEVLFQNMKKKGDNIPQLPSLEDFFKEEE